MSRVNRRLFIAGSVLAIAAPALGARTRMADVDVVIIGAGAAGIAAGRRVAAAKRNTVIFEASNHIGGRCITDTKLFGVPFDLGAHWIHNPDSNRLLAELPPKSGLDIYQAPRAQGVRIGLRNARDTERENFFAALARSRRAIAEATRAKIDMPAFNALPRDVGDWRATIEFILGPYTCGKDLGQVSALDLARLGEHENNSFCRQGYGTLLTKLTAGLPIHLSTPVTKINWSEGLLLETPWGNVRASAVIVTASVKVLTSKKIAFVPALPTRHFDAATQLLLSSCDHIALEMPGNPLNLQPDDVIFEQASSSRTAALLANVSGSALHLIEVGGAFGRGLAAQGEAAMVEFAATWLAAMFGANAKRAIRRAHATRWNNEPWVLGAISTAAPGGEGARRVLMEPLGGRIYFAGEAAHETQWGTVTGAWESGTRAAEAALRRIGALAPLPEDHPVRRNPNRQPRRRWQ